MKDIIYSISLIPFYPWAGLYWLMYRFQKLFLDERWAFSNQSQALARIAGIRGQLLRHAFYRMTLAKCGKRVTISYGTILADSECEIDDYVYIGAYCTLGLVSIGKHSMLGSNVDIPSGKNIHGSERCDIPMQLQVGTVTRIFIGSDVWLGNGSLVLADVSDHAIVGAGAVVTNVVPKGAIVAGNPAKIIRYRDGFKDSAV